MVLKDFLMSTYLFPGQLWRLSSSSGRNTKFFRMKKTSVIDRTQKMSPVLLCFSSLLEMLMFFNTASRPLGYKYRWLFLPKYK